MNYEDIIGLPHHVSQRHPHMPVSDRAAQFAPFAALTGYGDVIKETARQTEERPELSEDERAALDYKLHAVLSIPGQKPEITITYFVPDPRKSGGAFRKAAGRIRRKTGSSLSSRKRTAVFLCFLSGCGTYWMSVLLLRRFVDTGRRIQTPRISDVREAL